MKTKSLAVGCAALVAAGATAAVTQSYDPSLIAYSYEYYADAEMTEHLGSAYDTCVDLGGTVVVSNPYIPTPYYTQTPMYVCSDMGPWLPPGW